MVEKDAGTGSLQNVAVRARSLMRRPSLAKVHGREKGAG